MALLMTKDVSVYFVVGLLLRATWHSASVYMSRMVRDENGERERKLPRQPWTNVVHKVTWSSEQTSEPKHTERFYLLVGPTKNVHSS